MTKIFAIVKCFHQRTLFFHQWLLNRWRVPTQSDRRFPPATAASSRLLRRPPPRIGSLRAPGPPPVDLLPPVGLVTKRADESATGFDGASRKEVGGAGGAPGAWCRPRRRPCFVNPTRGGLAPYLSLRPPSNCGTGVATCVVASAHGTAMESLTACPGCAARGSLPRRPWSLATPKICFLPSSSKIFE
jgi:hypothetical protein